ncbi:hypothetical protein KIPB_014950, partial [Kipferlia bialata]|eukprot:g14950.t1
MRKLFVILLLALLALAWAEDTDEPGHGDPGGDMAGGTVYLDPDLVPTML